MPNDTQKFIVDVVPLIRMPLGKMQSFSYLSENEVPPGSLVSVPLFRRSVEGVVIGNRNDFERFGNIKLRPINRVIRERFLTQTQLYLGNFLADYFFTPLGLALKQFTPKIVKERSQHPEAKIKNEESKGGMNKYVLTTEQVETASKITFENHSKFLLYGPSSSGKTDVYIHTMLKIRKTNPDAQFLVLLPDLTLTPQALMRYSDYFSSPETAVLHSKLSKGAFFTHWENIRTGKAKLIIGSRLSVFAPFKNLKLIVIDEEQDISHKNWDQSPRYDGRVLAEKLAELHQSPLVLGTATPRIESFYRAQQGELSLLELSPLPHIPIPQFEIVNMRFEKADHTKKKTKRPWSFISQALASEIAFNLKWNRQTVLFHNRQGMSAFSVCMNCNELFRCPKCQRALVYNEDGTYHCLHCSHKTSLFPECPKCHSLKFKNVGFGTSAIEREIRSLFPKARVERADTPALKKPEAQQKLYADFSAHKFDILIGTQTIAKGWDLPNVGLVGIIDADQLMQIPDFSTNERAFQLLVQAAGRTGRSGAKFNGKVIIQTYSPENFVIHAVAKNSYPEFFKKELAEREILKLPPFTTLIKLVFRDESSDKVAKAADRFFDYVTEFVKTHPKITAIPPHSPLLENIRGRQQRQIILKVKGPLDEQQRSALRPLIAKAEAGWIIDVNPISII